MGAGSHVAYVRNPNYWDPGKPYLDELVVRIIPDGAARRAAFETGDVDLGGATPVAPPDVARFAALPYLGLESRATSTARRSTNRVQPRQPVPAPPRRTPGDRPRHRPPGPAQGGVVRARRSLRQRGEPDAQGILQPGRTALRLRSGPRRTPPRRGRLPAQGPDPFHAHTTITSPSARASNAPARSSAPRSPGSASTSPSAGRFPSYLRRVYTDRDFDFTNHPFTNMFDPTVGLQRFFTSDNVRKGVAFTQCQPLRQPGGRPPVRRHRGRGRQGPAQGGDRRDSDDPARRPAGAATVPQPVDHRVQPPVVNHTVGATGVSANFSSCGCAADGRPPCLTGPVERYRHAVTWAAF